MTTKIEKYAGDILEAIDIIRQQFSDFAIANGVEDPKYTRKQIYDILIKPQLNTLNPNKYEAGFKPTVVYPNPKQTKAMEWVGNPELLDEIRKTHAKVVNP